jgi:hypothetical protein
MLWGPVEVSRGAAGNFERPPVPAMAVWVDDERRAPAHVLYVDGTLAWRHRLEEACSAEQEGGLPTAIAGGRADHFCHWRRDSWTAPVHWLWRPSVTHQPYLTVHGCTLLYPSYYWHVCQLTDVPRLHRHPFVPCAV